MQDRYAVRGELLGGVAVRALLEDQLAQSSAGWSDRGGIAPDTVDCPVGVTAMAGGHVLAQGGVFAVAAGALERRCAAIRSPLANNLDAICSGTVMCRVRGLQIFPPR